MQKLSDNYIQQKSKDYIAGWTGKTPLVTDSNYSHHLLTIRKLSDNDFTFTLMMSKMIGNRVHHSIIFRLSYNLWIPGISSKQTSIELGEHISFKIKHIDPLLSYLILESSNEVAKVWDTMIKLKFRYILEKHRLFIRKKT